MTCGVDSPGHLRKQKQDGEVPGTYPNLTGKRTFEQRLEGADGGRHAGKSIGNGQCRAAELRGVGRLEEPLGVQGGLGGNQEVVRSERPGHRARPKGGGHCPLG